MSQIEQQFRSFLSSYPHIEKSYALGLINRRALARFLILNGVGDQKQLEALIAMIRRYDFEQVKHDHFTFKDIKISTKDNIVITTIEKNEDNVMQLRELLRSIKPFQTFKVIMGSSTITVIMDKEHAFLSNLFDQNNSEVSEVSIVFPKDAPQAKGILSTLTRELSIHDIALLECLTASSEVLLYVSGNDAVTTYSVLSNLKNLSKKTNS